MRHYTFFFASGKAREFDAEMDTLKEGAVILSKKKEFKSEIVRTDVLPQVVAVVSLANLDYYEYRE
jgi:hypothetical protein